MVRKTDLSVPGFTLFSAILSDILRKSEIGAFAIYDSACKWPKRTQVADRGVARARLL